MAWMWLWWILGLGVLVLLVWAIARAAGGGSAGPPRSEDSPEAILKRRYARGELNDEEYERQLTNLKK